MIIRCWGARGSIPVSGREYIKYGGSTTCIEIQTLDDQILIMDAGSGIRKLGLTLLKEARRDLHLIFTHAHWDHLVGLPFFGPIYREGTHIRFYGCPYAQQSVRGIFSGAMQSPNFPVDFSAVKAEIEYGGVCRDAFPIGSVMVTPIPLSHPNQGIGYKVSEEGKHFVFLTDNELSHPHVGGLDFAAYREFSKGADLLIHDAQYTAAEYPQHTKGWGHSLYTDALRLGMEAGVQRLGLFHHDPERTDEGVDAMAGDCQRILEERQSSLECFGVHEGLEIDLS
ncbi:MAG: MBL fold metallo-hydrolase [candidate division NC10 bacterium]|nr:MBL fold metallo-hydrolase [candidate division NC10 bacterium]